MIRKVEHERKMFVKSWINNYKKESHTEQYLITTYWILFIPVFRSKKITKSNI